MAKMEIFSYAGATFGVYNEEGTPLFRIGDILCALNEQRTTALLEDRLKESDYIFFTEERGGEIHSTEGVNEIGLFRLILTSPNKDEAEHFYLWVTSKVIPYVVQFIRKEHPHRYNLSWGSFFSDVAERYTETGKECAELLWAEQKMPYALPDIDCLVRLADASFSDLEKNWRKHQEKKTEPKLKIVTSDNSNDG